jgi:hypothetical protein
MITRSLRNIDLFRVEGEASDQSCYGSNQDWYKKRWQRMAGCGPSAVANIIYYLERTGEGKESQPNLTRSEYLELMEEIWSFVTPSLGGVSSTAMLCRGAERYITSKGRSVQMEFIDIPKKRSDRPDIRQVTAFIDAALQKDLPVAFLNLEHGSVRELESWHWVTIVTQEYEPDGSKTDIRILDGGWLKQISLSDWYRTTKMGGGFVSFELKN